ncbi:hypothetical protein C2W62_40750 [Candidatus Entotheonella serta]|nr:hypothetical protein C2W62_40750 [Candidatus Entotheonella serta]
MWLYDGWRCGLVHGSDHGGRHFVCYALGHSGGRGRHCSVGGARHLVGIPNAVEGEGWNEPVYMTMGFVFFYSVAVITVNDIRDIVGDQVAGTRSLAVILGERWARALCIGCVSLAACIGLALDSIGLVVAAGLLGLTVVTYRREINDLFSWNFSIIVLIIWIVVLFLG